MVNHPNRSKKPATVRLQADADRLDWLQDRIVDTIYLDDGTIIDVRGDDIRSALDTARSRNAQN